MARVRSFASNGAASVNRSQITMCYRIYRNLRNHSVLQQANECVAADPLHIHLLVACIQDFAIASNYFLINNICI